MSPEDLQKNTSPITERPRGRRMGKMSERLNGYMDLIATGNIGNQTDLAAELYLDMHYSDQSIQTMQAMIQHQLLLSQVRNWYGMGITDGMKNIVAKVKGVIYGEQVASNTGEYSNPALTESQHDSDLIYRP